MIFLKKCPLTIRFGKDIASLIHLRVWRLNMKDVISDYHDHIRECRYEQSITWLLREGYGFLFNFRTKEETTGLIYNVRRYNRKDSWRVAELPKHYWSIKEFY